MLALNQLLPSIFLGVFTGKPAQAPVSYIPAPPLLAPLKEKSKAFETPGHQTVACFDGLGYRVAKYLPYSQSGNTGNTDFTINEGF